MMGTPAPAENEARTPQGDFSSHRFDPAPFQRRWLSRTFQKHIDTSALSVARGNGKTALAGWLAAQSITPGSKYYRDELETVIVAASIDQARLLFDAACKYLPTDAYRIRHSKDVLGAQHKKVGTARIRAISSNPRTALGLSQFGLIIADEPGAWEERGGTQMFDALRQSMGKIEGQKLILIGTRAPAVADSWWPMLLEEGSGEGTHVRLITPKPKAKWYDNNTVRDANPLSKVHPPLWAKLKRERDAAKKDDRLRRAFEAYRLNKLVDVSDSVLIEVADWARIVGREVPEREGQPVIGLDLGASMSWCAAWCLWPNGRSEVHALMPGIPTPTEMERRAALPRGRLRSFIDDGVLHVEKGRRSAQPETLIQILKEKGISNPAAIVADRFRAPALADACRGFGTVTARQTRWSEATEDISAFWRLALDEGLTVVPEAHGLVQFALSEATLRTDDQDSYRIIKRRGVRSRDDVVQAGVLAAGLWYRRRGKQPRKVRFHVA